MSSSVVVIPLDPRSINPSAIEKIIERIKSPCIALAKAATIKQIFTK
ncbi:hypothetical protein [Methanosarcina horonobensis]|nr:hypothetical protein [Methanosarcina horonobensis]